MAARLMSKGAAVDDAKKLTGPEKAAVVLLSLGEEHTALWLSHIHNTEPTRH